jgi:putative ABC transport system substrate-binding protein
LREIVPGLSVVAVLYNKQGTTTPGATIARAATALGLRLHPVGVAVPADLDDAVASAAAAGASGMIVLADPVIMDRRRQRIAELALRHRLPSVSAFRIHAEAGGLASYAEDLVDMHRRSAVFVDKILKGGKPADLPVEQPTKFELVINLRTARALGIEIPPSVLARADAVIE